MGATGFRLPVNQTIEDTIKWLTWDQFPVLLDKSIKYFSVLPQIGTYQHFNSTVVPFMEQLHNTTDREFTLSGIGSFIDYDRYGQNLKRPSPQLLGSGCAGNSLCVEPTCFGFTEGVIENNQIMQNICWSLMMPCLKDQFYSDRRFEMKIKAYFKMFFEQGPAVSQAYQRTRLLQEAIKIVATDTNIHFTGSLVGGASGLSLPFWFNPEDPFSFPDLDTLPAGVGVGGVNLAAFIRFLANRLFAGSFGGGMNGFDIYGLKQDYEVAKQQTASVEENYAQLALLERLASNKISGDYIDGMLNNSFKEDGLFPTFAPDATTNVLNPVTYEILEPATIAGYVQNPNPDHPLSLYRGLLLVPKNWRFNFVEPPRDDFSDLGLGNGLNFRNYTPGVFPILSSSMFTNSQVGEDGTVVIGQRMGENGMLQQVAQGLAPRERAIQEAIRTQIFMTYSAVDCTAPNGQLPNVGRPMTPQASADGFSLKSTMYVGTDVQGQAKPVLLLFKTDTPRSARPIVVCTTKDVSVTEVAAPSIASCCPGDRTYAILSFTINGSTNTPDMTDYFDVDDEVIYRTGAKGMSFAATVTAVDGAVVSIEADGEGVTLPCCSGSPDDYGTRAVLINLEGVTNKTSDIFKALVDTTLMVELVDPVGASWLDNALVDVTLENGDVIHLQTVGASAGASVFMELELAVGETCTLADLDCNCLARASLTLL